MSASIGLEHDIPSFVVCTDFRFLILDDYVSILQYMQDETCSNTYLQSKLGGRKEGNIDLTSPKTILCIDIETKLNKDNTDFLFTKPNPKQRLEL